MKQAILKTDWNAHDIYDIVYQIIWCHFECGKNPEKLKNKSMQLQS